MKLNWADKYVYYLFTYVDKIKLNTGFPNYHYRSGGLLYVDFDIKGTKNMKQIMKVY